MTVVSFDGNKTDGEIQPPDTYPGKMESRNVRSLGPIAADISCTHGCGTDRTLFCIRQGLRLRTDGQTVLGSSCCFQALRPFWNAHVQALASGEDVPREVRILWLRDMSRLRGNLVPNVDVPRYQGICSGAEVGFGEVIRADAHLR